MAEKLALIERWFRIIAIAVLVGLVIAGAAQLYDYYHNRAGATAEKAVYAWVAALTAGDSEAVVQLTARDRLTDIYGRRITESEFRRQVTHVTGDEAVTVRLSQAPTLIAEDRAVAYYLVKLTSTASGASGDSRLILEVSQQGGKWVVTWPFAIVL